MGRSFGAMRADTPLPELQNLTHAPSEQQFSITRRDDKPYLRRTQANTNILESEINYWFGSGNHARSYLHRTAAGELIELPLTWYTEDGGHWGMSPAFDQPQHAGFSRKIGYRCFFCHNGYPQIDPETPNWDGATQFPPSLPEGIDCQRCHGPGQNHIDAIRNKQSPEAVRKAIVNPARLSPTGQLEVCMQCHLETTSAKLPNALLRYGRTVFSYRPGEPLEDYILHFDQAPGTGHDEKFEIASSPYRLRKSQCFLKSGGTLTCTTCHNPHNVPRGAEAADHNSQACRRCHAAAVAKLPNHSAASDCVSCHMPKRRPSDVIHVSMTDHFIRKRPVPVDPQVESHDNNTPPYRGPVALYYPAAAGELYLAVAQVTQQSNSREGLPRLEKAIAREAPERSEFYFELGKAYSHAGRLQDAIAAYRQACSREPANWLHFFSLGTALYTAGSLRQSREALLHAASIAPKEIVVHLALADTQSLEGNLPDAVATLKAAKAIDPESAETRNNLGTVLLRIGDIAAAGAELREAARLRPELPAIRINLANLLARRGNFAEAKQEFESALRRSPAFAEGHSAYATALAARGNLKEARAQFETALQLDPQFAAARNNLGTLLLRQGDVEGALREYRQALVAGPNSAEAHFNLGLTLADQGKTAEAEAHVMRTTRLFEAAGRHFNRGQRAFFFALGYLGWFVSPWVLFLTTAAVVIVTWRRQFASNAWKAMG